MDVTSFALLDPRDLDTSPRTKGSLPGHLSISAANMYAACPRSWWHRYVDLTPGKVTDDSFLRFGKAIHAVLEWMNHTHQESGLWPTATKIDLKIDEVVRAHGPWSPGEVDDRIQEGVRLIYAFLSSGGRSLQPVMTETPFLMEGPGGLRVYGIIDLTTPTGVWDYKTSWHPMHLDGGVATDQLNIYALVYYKITGSWPEDLGLINMIRKTGTCDWLQAECQPDQVIESAARMVSIWEASRAGTYPATPSVRACKYCLWKEGCPEKH
jgi:hypothetical protein